MAPTVINASVVPQAIQHPLLMRNAQIVATLASFGEFNVLRKNQLLRYYHELGGGGPGGGALLLRGCVDALNRLLTGNHKYRDYCTSLD